MGDLQPITLLAELAERQMAKVPPEIDKARDSITKTRQQARTAVGSMSSVLAWITGEESPAVQLQEGIDACVDLLRTDSEVRGVRITRAQCEENILVSRRTLRMLTSACIIAAVDMRPPVTEIQVRCGSAGDCAYVRIELRHTDDGAREDAVGDERLLTWGDVDVIAEVEGVTVERSAEPFVVQWRMPLLGH